MALEETASPLTSLQLRQASVYTSPVNAMIKPPINADWHVLPENCFPVAWIEFQ